MDSNNCVSATEKINETFLQAEQVSRCEDEQKCRCGGMKMNRDLMFKYKHVKMQMKCSSADSLSMVMQTLRSERTD